MDRPPTEGPASAGRERVPLGIFSTALVVSGVGLITAAALAGVAAALLTWSAPSFNGTVTLAQILFAATFGCGADVEPQFSASSFHAETEFEYHMVPLLFTLIALAVMVRVFRSLTGSYTSARTAVTIAGLSAAFCGLFVLISSLMLESDVDRILPSRDLDLSGPEGTPIHVDLLEAVSMPALLVAGVLLATIVTRRDWLSGVGLNIHDWFAVPMRGMVCFLWAIPLAGLVMAVMLVAGGGFDAEWQENDDLLSFAIGAQLVFVGHSGVMAIGLGAGAPYGTRYDYTDEAARGLGLDSDVSTNTTERLLSLSESDPALLALPVVTLLAVLFSARFVITRSPTERTVAGDLVRWVLVLAAALPGIAYATSFRFHSLATASSDDDGLVYRAVGNSTLGVDLLPFAGLVAVFAAFASVIMFVIYSDMDRLGDPRNRTGMRWQPDQSASKPH